MSYHLVLGLLSAGFPLFAAIPYLKSILSGTTRPNTVSYGLWLLQGIIDVVASISAGATWPAIFAVVLTFNTGIVFLLTLTGYGYKRYGLSDAVCAGFAILALVGWQITGNPLVALVLSLFAGLFSALPTFLKTYHDPASEYYPAWMLVMLGAACSVASASIFDFANLAFPAYSFMEAAVIVGLAYFGTRGLGRSANKSA